MAFTDSLPFSINVIASSLPSYANISVGTVASISGTNNPDSVQSTLTSYSGLGNPVNLIRAWCGGCLSDIGGHPYLVIHGGGHGDYGGNEVLKFGPLDSNTPAWSVVSNPTPDAQVIAEAAYNSDGKPNVSHTRSLLAALGGRMYRAGQPGVWITATPHNTNDSVNLSTGTWASAGTHADVSFGSGIRGSLTSDPIRGVLWYVSDQIARLYKYDPVSNTWTQYTPTWSAGNTLHSAYSQSRDEVCAVFGGTTALYNLSSPTSAPITTGFTGTAPGGDSGLTWDSGRGVYAGLDTSGSRNVIRELNPTTKVWSTRTFTGTYETAPDDSNGIFGRFQYVPLAKGYIYIGSTSGQVYFYRSHS